jgi:hypothetical protein
MLLAPVHTDLELMKNSGKATSKRSGKFPNLSDAKIKRGAFGG